jgi:hypothetical protein
MSANRIVKRRAFAASRPNGHAHWAAFRRAEATSVVRPTSVRPTYHAYAITGGDRHPTFQKNIRAARAEHGLQPTSSDMSRVHGRRVA